MVTAARNWTISQCKESKTCFYAEYRDIKVDGKYDHWEFFCLLKGIRCLGKQADMLVEKILKEGVGQDVRN